MPRSQCLLASRTCRARDYLMGLWSHRRKWIDQNCLYSLYSEHPSQWALRRWVLMLTKFSVAVAQKRNMVKALSNLRRHAQWIGESKNEWIKIKVAQYDALTLWREIDYLFKVGCYDWGCGVSVLWDWNHATFTCRIYLAKTSSKWIIWNQYPTPWSSLATLRLHNWFLCKRQSTVYHQSVLTFLKLASALSSLHSHLKDANS